MVRRQDLALLLLYYLGYSRIRNLVFRLKQKPVTRIVMFHDILPEASGFFKANLYFLKRHTNVVSLDDFFSGKLSSKKINVVITFDDGYKSWVTLAVPTLKELGYDAVYPSPLEIIGPKGMPKPLVQKIHDAFRKAPEKANDGGDKADPGGINPGGRPCHGRRHHIRGHEQGA